MRFGSGRADAMCYHEKDQHLLRIDAAGKRKSTVF